MVFHCSRDFDIKPNQNPYLSISILTSFATVGLKSQISMFGIVSQPYKDQSKRTLTVPIKDQGQNHVCLPINLGLTCDVISWCTLLVSIMLPKICICPWVGSTVSTNFHRFIKSGHSKIHTFCQGGFMHCHWYLLCSTLPFMWSIIRDERLSPASGKIQDNNVLFFLFLRGLKIFIFYHDHSFLPLTDKRIPSHAHVYTRRYI